MSRYEVRYILCRVFGHQGPKRWECIYGCTWSDGTRRYFDHMSDRARHLHCCRRCGK